MRLHDLEIPLKTHLDLLALGTERAARDGIFAARAPGNRASIVLDVCGRQAQGWTEPEFNERLDLMALLGLPASTGRNAAHGDLACASDEGNRALFPTSTCRRPRSLFHRRRNPR